MPKIEWSSRDPRDVLAHRKRAMIIVRFPGSHRVVAALVIVDEGWAVIYNDDSSPVGEDDTWPAGFLWTMLEGPVDAD